MARNSRRANVRRRGVHPYDGSSMPVDGVYGKDARALVKFERLAEAEQVLTETKSWDFRERYLRGET